MRFGRLLIFSRPDPEIAVSVAGRSKRLHCAARRRGVGASERLLRATRGLLTCADASAAVAFAVVVDFCNCGETLLASRTTMTREATDSDSPFGPSLRTPSRSARINLGTRAKTVLGS